MNKIKNYIPGILLTIVFALLGKLLSGFIPHGLISPSVFGLLLGMIFNPYIANNKSLTGGIKFVAKKVLKIAIILMGVSLNIYQVAEVGKYSLFVMCFTLFTAFFFGHLLGKAFHMNWKLSSLISAGTGICGGSAIASIAPTIEAENSDVAYAISATFIFDIVMVILFPIAGKYFGMSDLGYGLWAGTAVNDTSSVVAAGYAFSEAAGNFAIIVKLTRTLSIVPVVLIFSVINSKTKHNKESAKKVDVKAIFPWFILLFLVVVGINSTGIIPATTAINITKLSKFLMIMSLSAIGLSTNFKEMSKSGFLPMVHGFIISLLVVIVSFCVQYFVGQI
ncbi:YeiH family protein [Peptoniphilus stercorisuis]|uniref:Integral membrane protein (TIGR00698 family) n=1 Tax=Peptoniphilus stercorisuis TaxID=1436965 RepID=A0ABS4KE99_9FIRM|nr:YeiH family protein [Peptoniphilus stercorisuis]MBP2026097.1 putative integral membrane protein (TIGR00698 family) [Peptoniphilus stercorisuis]